LAEVRVRVSGEERYVLLGTSLKAVAPAEAALDRTVLARVKLRRRYDGRLVSVHLPRAAPVFRPIQALSISEYGSCQEILGVGFGHVVEFAGGMFFVLL
jgi:hypothetical protein